MKRPTCDKCGQPMRSNGSTSKGRPQYICYKGGEICSRKVTKARHTEEPKAPAPKVYRRKIDRTVRRFIVTAAQNASPVHADFLRSLETACNHLNAELLVVPFRYKNPTSRFHEAGAQWYDDKVKPYLWNVRRALNKNLILLGDVRTQPTASNPLSGFEGLTHGESGILAHPKLQLRSIPRSPGEHPKIMVTTGACTAPDYTSSKAGALGEFHHQLGAAMVEIQGKSFHLRQLNAVRDTGAFIDWDKEYSPRGVRPAPPALALSLGDTHVAAVDPVVDRVTFEQIIPALKPANVIYHDLLDGESVNPHTRANPFAAVARRFGSRDDAQAEVEAALEYVAQRSKGFTSVLVPSNHHDFLQRWLISSDWRTDPQNAEFYLETALAMVRAAKSGAEAEKLDAFGYWARRRFGDDPAFRVLRPDEKYLLAGVDLSLHGDRGPNGARGSIRNLSRIGVKVIIGHSHSPGIQDGAYQNGTMTGLRLGYTHGPSSWMNTHTALYGNGKRSLLNIINGNCKL